MNTAAPNAADVERGQQVYTPLVLRAYDLFVLGFSNHFAWQCRTVTMLERYDRHVGGRHLDLGVGTDWYLDRCAWPVDRPEITLLDLNENSLSMAARRLRRYAPQTVRANVVDPLPLGDARFDSAAANYLLHCLPGQIESKAASLAGNVRPYLEPGGVLFGSTILGRGVSPLVCRIEVRRAWPCVRPGGPPSARRGEAGADFTAGPGAAVC
jgi:hypothetical protein